MNMLIFAEVIIKELKRGASVFKILIKLLCGYEERWIKDYDAKIYLQQE